ncbi:MAG TPA: hypothetical protein VM802_21070 [Chitinophaga sp.]|uniref:hypothetical protein n=1 Tax=Chitinophaga sp. TaxID=1869181 RepID=UPI002B665D56|nr:hypothetical protein [Chitinophaga sp.]HVI47384.1 hypothetical protein [Chitinophaga sp.]
MIKKLLLYFFFFGTTAIPAIGQSVRKNPSPVKPAAIPSKPKKLKSSWGLFLSDTLPKSEVIRLLDSSLQVRDEKNNKYKVVSFAFTYEKHEPYLNDTTGQPGVYKDFTGDNFKSSSLPALWSNRLKQTLDKGDVLYFDEIIIRYPPDKLYMAPSLRINIK